MSKESKKKTAWADVAPEEPVPPLPDKSAKTTRKTLFRMDTREHNKLKQVVEENNKRTRWVLLPTSPRMQIWGSVMLLVIGYTFIVTPVQVAFMREPSVVLFSLNRLMDAAFLVDCILNFFLAYRKHPSSPQLVTDWATIRSRYFYRWFLLDALSLLSSISEIVDFVDQSHAYTKQALRFSRLLCVFRLAKVARMAVNGIGFETMLRWLNHILGTSHVSVYVELLVRWIFKLLLMAHFAACLWGLVATAVNEVYGDTVKTWVTALFDSNPQLSGRDNTLLLYLLSLYWSLMTLATIGYGDIVPKCLAEYLVATSVMVVSATMWTILMAQACCVIALKDEKLMTESIEVEAIMDMCHDYDLQVEMRHSVKKYFLQSRRMLRHYKHQEVLKLLSPALQSQITAPLHEPYLRRVPFLSSKMIESGLIKLLARALEPSVHSPSEWIVPQQLLPFVTETDLLQAVTFTPRNKQVNESRTRIGELEVAEHLPLTIMKTGVGLHNAMLATGSVWHEDCILSLVQLRDGRVAQAVGFCAVYTLPAPVLVKSLQRGDFPFAASQVKRRAVKLAVLRLVKRAAAAEQATHSGLAQCIREVVEAGRSPHADDDEDEDARANAAATTAATTAYISVSASSPFGVHTPRSVRAGSKKRTVAVSQSPFALTPRAGSSQRAGSNVSNLMTSMQAMLDQLRQELQESKEVRTLLTRKLEALSQTPEVLSPCEPIQLSDAP